MLRENRAMNMRLRGSTHPSTIINAWILTFFSSIASPSLNLFVAFGFGVAGTVYFALFGRDLGRLAGSVKDK